MAVSVVMTFSATVVHCQEALINDRHIVLCMYTDFGHYTGVLDAFYFSFLLIYLHHNYFVWLYYKTHTHI